MRDFRELKVWGKAHQFMLAVYEATAGFPREELCGLTSQIRRSASSIPANIAEGCGTSTRTEFARYLQLAMGSASELDYDLLLARDLKMLQAQKYEQLAPNVTEVKRMLAPFIGKLRVVG